MKSKTTIEVDGKVYSAGQEYPDLGSLVCISNVHELRKYKGLEKDIDKLPTGKTEGYKDLKTGSSFMAIDSDVYMVYEATTQSWYNKE